MTNPTHRFRPACGGSHESHPVAACTDRPRAPAGSAAASRALVAPSPPERLRWAGLWRRWPPSQSSCVYWWYGRYAVRPRWATASANGSTTPGVARRTRDERAGGAVGVAVAGRAAEPVGEVRAGVSGAQGVLRRWVRRVAVGQHHRGAFAIARAVPCCVR